MTDQTPVAVKQIRDKPNGRRVYVHAIADRDAKIMLLPTYPGELVFTEIVSVSDVADWTLVATVGERCTVNADGIEENGLLVKISGSGWPVIRHDDGMQVVYDTRELVVG